MRIKCLVHTFSGSEFGSAVDKRTRNNCMRALSVKYIYLAARWARREIVVTKTCRIIKTNGCDDQFLFIQTVLAVSHIRRSTSLRTQTYFRLLLVPPA